MSSILKALKKLEEEKTTRKPATLKIQTERSSGMVFGVTPLKAVSAALFLFMCGGGATYFYLHSTVKKTSTSHTTNADRKDISAVVSPTTPVEHVKSEPITPAAILSSAPSKPFPKVPAVKQTTQELPKKNPADPIAGQEMAKKSIEPDRELSNTAPKSDVPQAPASIRPLLKVDGIASQEGTDNVAMINGVQATKASVIEGARIEAILKDRVVFSLGNDRFEVLLGQTSHRIIE